MPRRPSLEEAPGLFAGPGEAAAAAAAKPEKPHHLGHRERLRERLTRAGPQALADYEVLELVLALAIPRGDLKPTAKRLLETFGDFAHVISAPRERLAEVKGVGAGAVSALKVVEAAAHRLSAAKVIGRPALSSWAAVVEHCRTVMAHRNIEEFRVLYLDNRNVLIEEEVQGRGTVNHTPVYPREVVRRALALDAMAVIIAHNHPSGDPTPSEADIAMTGKIRDALAAVQITLHDHLIVGKSRETSFRAQGLL